MSHAEALRTPRPQAAAKPDAAAFGYRVDIESEYWRVQTRWERLAKAGAATALQRQSWLSAFYASVGRRAGVEPVLATVSDSLSGRDLLALPLVRVRRGRLNVIAFADEGMTDYNAPIIGAWVPRDFKNIREIWRAIRRSLPRADLVVLERMPRAIDGVLNPLAQLEGVRPSATQGHVLAMPNDWQEWREGLERRFRRELDRAARLFSEQDEPSFRFINNAEEAHDLFFGLKRHQKSSVVDLQGQFFLDQPAVRLFYDRLFSTGLSDGSVMLSALMVGEEPIAALLGLADGRDYTLVHLATAGGRWKIMSPGRLLIDQTINALHREGFRRFDFTTGDYPYRRMFGARPEPLFDARIAISWRALPTIISSHARRAIGRKDEVRKTTHQLGAYS